MKTKPTLYLIDDMQDTLTTLKDLFDENEVDVRAFTSAKDFLNSYVSKDIECVVVDLKMPEVSGIELCQKIKSLNTGLPIVVYSGNEVVATAVEAMRVGCYEYLEKTCSPKQFVQTVRNALQFSQVEKTKLSRINTAASQFRSLTPREKDVCKAVVAGKTNKTMAEEFGITLSTLEIHRKRVMTKMESNSVAQLVEKVSRLEPQR